MVVPIFYPAAALCQGSKVREAMRSHLARAVMVMQESV
jgi:hypothetical protein